MKKVIALVFLLSGCVGYYPNGGYNPQGTNANNPCCQDPSIYYSDVGYHVENTIVAPDSDEATRHIVRLVGYLMDGLTRPTNCNCR